MGNESLSLGKGTRTDFVGGLGPDGAKDRRDQMGRDAERVY